MVGAQKPLQFPQSLTDPHFLAARTWKSDSGLKDAVRSWPIYSGKQEFEDKTVENAAKVEVFGVTLDAQYRTLKGSGAPEIVKWGPLESKSDNIKTCSDVLESAQNLLGKPVHLIDASVLSQTIELEADWLFNQTRVRVGCRGVEMDGKFIFGAPVIVYQHKDLLAALEELVHIECTSRIKSIGLSPNSAVEEGAPIRFIIDPNNGELRRADKSRLGKTEKFTNEEIVSMWEDETAQNKLSIDRLGGSYLLKVSLKNDGHLGIDRWGKCSKIIQEKRF